MKAFDAIVVVGPTASGKSALAMALAAHLDAEIVSCDSVQVYQGFDIGSAKPTRAEQQTLPHHLIDVATWPQPMDAGLYADLAMRAVSDIRARGKWPLIVGGTGLYLRALLADRWHAELPKDQELRDRLKPSSTEHLSKMLRKLDAARADQIHPHDRVRLLRAIELRLLSGPDWRQHQQKAEPLLKPLLVWLDLPRPELHRRIAERVEAMLNAGLVDEVRALLAAGCPKDARPMQAIGYRQVLDYLDGQYDLPQLASAITIATRQYAKRQNTWFKKLPANAHIKSVADLQYTCKDILRLLG